MDESALDRFPPELLLEIYQACILDDPRHVATLALLNRRWYMVSTSFPSLYQFIFFELVDPKDVLRIRRQIAHWIRRSSPLLFDVDITAATHNSFFPLLIPIVGESSRLGRVRLQWDKYERIWDFKHVPVACNALIVNFAGRIGSLRHRQDEKSAMPRLLREETQSKTSLTLDVQVNCIPSPRTIENNSFTRLSVLEFFSPAEPCHPSEVLRLLTAMSNLETFSWHALRDEHNLENLPKRVALYKLKSLALRGTTAIRSILSCLVTPALQNLILRDITRHHPIADEDSIQGEDGDSEDEAGDYSQSPYSDRAIGMGIRKLVRNSSPPLQKLYMDYADMRTKDFRWTFDNLNLLTGFRITGSDLSHNVTNMLVPYTPLGQEGGPRLRMPWLTELEFISTLSVSGDALVESLIARDKFAEQNRGYERLQKLSIVRCSDVRSSHGERLREIFGSRLIEFELVN